MKPHLFLVPVSVDGASIQLPCPATALLESTVANLRTRKLSKSKSVSMLVAHPALLTKWLGSFRAGQKVSSRVLKSSLAELSPLNPVCQNAKVERLQYSKSLRSFWKRLAGCKNDRQFWKALSKWLGDCGRLKVSLKRKNLPRISKGLLKRVVRTAKRLLQADSNLGLFMDLPKLLGRLERLQKIEADFESELQNQKLDSMRLLAYGASHEINNPLANIASRAQSLLKDELDSTRQHRLAVIYEQAMRAHEMISDMMLFAHPPAVTFQAFNLSECVGRVVRELKDRCQRHRVQVKVKGEVWRLIGDETQWASAIKSLIVNAIEAIGSDGKILVAFGIDEEGARWLSVADDGPGVDQAIGNNIFDPFYSGREAGRGLGFGLSKVWRICRLHNAEIQRLSSVLGGAEFQIRFGLLKESSEKESQSGPVAA